RQGALRLGGGAYVQERVIGFVEGAFARVLEGFVDRHLVDLADERERSLGRDVHDLVALGAARDGIAGLARSLDEHPLPRADERRQVLLEEGLAQLEKAGQPRT